LIKLTKNTISLTKKKYHAVIDVVMGPNLDWNHTSDTPAKGPVSLEETRQKVMKVLLRRHFSFSSVAQVLAFTPQLKAVMCGVV
jgi:hypothetical protein